MTGRQWLEELHPLGRLGQAEEVANMILFLLSDELTFSTGSEFVCDGGLQPSSLHVSPFRRPDGARSTKWRDLFFRGDK